MQQVLAWIIIDEFLSVPTGSSLLILELRSVLHIFRSYWLELKQSGSS